MKRYALKWLGFGGQEMAERRVFIESGGLFLP